MRRRPPRITARLRSPRIRPGESYVAHVESMTILCPSGCHLWTGGTGSHGYGVIGYKGAVTIANRVLWQETHGVTLTRNQYVCHRCDNRLCCNIRHLFIGSAMDNTRDMVAKGRHCGGPNQPNKKAVA